jgi:hypothetical protein
MTLGEVPYGQDPNRNASLVIEKVRQEVLYDLGPNRLFFHLLGCLNQVELYALDQNQVDYANPHADIEALDFQGHR